MEITRELIIQHLDDPHRLEQAYRENKTGFRRALQEAFTEDSSHPVLRVWNERLNYASESPVTWGSASDWARILLLCLIAGTLYKLPQFLSLEEPTYYVRNISFFLLPFLSVYLSWKNGFRKQRLILLTAGFTLSAFYINLLPNSNTSDTLVLACVFLPIFSWSMTGVAFAGSRDYSTESRLDFLKFNGDFVVMNVVMGLAFGLFTALTIGLFGVIGVRIEEFYMKYILIYGLASAPIVSTHMVRVNPQLVNKVSPVIAKVFTPLVLINLSVYLVALIASNKDPYNDRDFLFVFNMLLLGVMAIIFFSVVEAIQTSSNRFGMWVLLLLSLVAVAVNTVALSAIVFRLFSMGITPNRIAVLGSNLLLLCSIVALSYRLFRVLRNNLPASTVAKGVTMFLPAFGIWAFIVAFLFPVLFGFK